MLKPQDIGEALSRIGSVLATLRDLISQECLLLEKRRAWITQVCDDFNLMCKESNLLTAGQDPSTRIHPPDLLIPPRMAQTNARIEPPGKPGRSFRTNSRAQTGVSDTATEATIRAELDRVLRRLSSVQRVASYLAEERRALHETIQVLTGTLERLEQQLAAVAEETSRLESRAEILES